jgi:hypothetical protein
MTTYAVGSVRRTDVRQGSLLRTHLPWLGSGLVLAFLVPYVLADQLALPRNAYYGVYAAFASSLFVGWAKATHQPLAELVRRRWRAAVVLGAVFGGVMALIVLSSDAGTHPAGLQLAGSILWRGIVYGAADGLLLSAFPILVVFAAFAAAPARRRLRGTLAIGLAALAASLGMTAAYHAGYGDFRSEKLRQPVAGDVVWSIPTLLTLNPVGALRSRTSGCT